MFKKITAEQSGISFTNKVTNTPDLNIFTYRNFYNGGGVATGDINNDGLQDVYLTANMGTNKLYLNQGNLQFKEITDQAGVGLNNKWSTGVVMVDINHDDLLDIYVCNAGYFKGQTQNNALFINNGDLTFTEKAEKYGLNDPGYTTHAAFLDYDSDGDLDVYLLNNSFIPTNTLNYSNKRDLPADEWPVADFLKGGGDKLLRNDGGTFIDVSKEAGIYQSLIGFGLGVVPSDYNNDGWTDLYVCNDFFERDYLYINDQKGGFEEKLEDYFKHISHSSMGADCQDINNDGLKDLFVTDMLPYDDYRLKTTASFDDINLRRLKLQKGFYHQYMHNTLQLNAGKKFKEISFHAGVAASDWSWGALMFDANNDRFQDLFVCNGIYNDVIDLDFMDFFASEVIQKMALTGEKETMDEVINNMPSVPLANQFFLNQGNLEFKEVSQEIGMGEASFSNGAAYSDLDNDGDYDIIVNNVNQESFLFENTSKNPSITVELKGAKENTQSIGASIKLYHGNEIQVREINPSRGFQSSSDTRQIFGLKDIGKIDSLQVLWADRNISTLFPNIKDSLIQISYEQSNKKAWKQPKNEALFTTKNTSFDSHKEDDYVDYYNERGIHRLLSREGPKAAVGDVNGDGLEDVFIGGATNQAGKIYLQTTDGFKEQTVPVLEKHLKFEDTAATLFDADQDGDLDLFVGSGGNHYQPNTKYLADRLYINEGKGIFNLSSDIQAKVSMNTADVEAHDFDQDGDLDLFVVSRSVPQYYVYAPIHFIFQNDGKGTFTEVSKQVINNFKGIGMICDIHFENIIGDDSKEMILVGEWDSPRIFEYKSNQYQEVKTNLNNYKGWYYQVKTGDFNGDGKMDLVLGNHGSNAYVKATPEKPLSIWINDFDNNGYVDKVLTYKEDGKNLPLFLKKDLADQVTSIKKQSIKHSEYATTGLSQLMDKGFQGAKEKQANYFKSFVALNQGNEKFKIVDLPETAQLSCIKAIEVNDIDQDGDLDLITAGNDYHQIPQFSRLDANFGSVLINDGKSNFTVMSESKSGLSVDGQTKEIKEIEWMGKTHFLFIRNNEFPVLVGKK